MSNTWAPPTPPSPAPRRPRWRRWAAIGAGIFAALMIVGTIGAIVAPPEDEPDVAPSSTVSDTVAVEPVVAPAPSTAPDTAPPVTEPAPTTTEAPPAPTTTEPFIPPPPPAVEVDVDGEYATWFVETQEEAFSLAQEGIDCATAAIDRWDLDEAAECSYTAALWFGVLHGNSADEQSDNDGELRRLAEEAWFVCSLGYQAGGEAIESMDEQAVSDATLSIQDCTGRIDAMTAFIAGSLS